MAGFHFQGLGRATVLRRAGLGKGRIGFARQILHHIVALTTREEPTMKHGIICGPQPEAVDVGAMTLKAGGNAVDAAIACALVQGVVDPMMCGIAGFGSMQLYLPGKGVHGLIDFHGKAPRATRPDMWEQLIEGETRDGFGFILRGRVNDIGYQSITVPGSLKAYHEAQTRHGRLPWAEIVAPAIAHARDGWTVRPHVAFWWSEEAQLGRSANSDRLRFTRDGAGLYCRADGSPKRIGDRVQNPDLANTLSKIAKHGADIFYAGEIAAAIARDMEAHGGLLDAEDLREYRTVWREPLWGSYRGRRIATNHPPGGGIMLVEMLNILEAFDLQSIGHNTAEYVRVVAEAMKRATIDKDAHVGDPAFVDIPIPRLTDKGYAGSLAAEIRAGKIARVPRLQGPAEPRQTTQISVTDVEGNVVSMTHSLGMPSGVITPGLGFMYNGAMAVFDPRPGRAGSLAPGKSRFSSLCPSILFSGDEPFMVIGAPGGTNIAMGVLQAILNMIDHGMSAVEAVSAARFSATSDTIDVTNRLSRMVTDELAGTGYAIARSPLSYTIAAVHALLKRDGVWEGGADPGHDGMAVAV
jgi:gamma-glutamyltranspeptidase/glutathione hydrolase